MELLFYHVLSVPSIAIKARFFDVISLASIKVSAALLYPTLTEASE